MEKNVLEEFSQYECVFLDQLEFSQCEKLFYTKLSNELNSKKSKKKKKKKKKAAVTNTSTKSVDLSAVQKHFQNLKSQRDRSSEEEDVSLTPCSPLDNLLYDSVWLDQLLFSHMEEEYYVNQSSKDEVNVEFFKAPQLSQTDEQLSGDESDELELGYLFNSDDDTDEELKVHSVFRLNHKNKEKSNYKWAEYYCRLCNYHYATKKVALGHITENAHSQLFKLSTFKKDLKVTKNPSDDRLRALSSYLLELSEEKALTDDCLVKRKRVFESIATLLKTTAPIDDIDFFLFESSVSGCGLKTAGLRIGVIPKSIDGPSSLTVLLSCMKDLAACEEPVISNVTDSFQSDHPLIHFTHNQSGLSCDLSLTSYSATFTSRVLRWLFQQDSRVPILNAAARYFAEVHGFTGENKEFLRPICFTMMMLHFLQKLSKPVLPHLETFIYIPLNVPIDDHTVMEETVSTLEKCSFKSENKDSVGALWLQFLYYYASSDYLEIIQLRTKTPISKKTAWTERKWKMRRIMIEDPCNPLHDLAKSLKRWPHFNYTIFCIIAAFRYFSSSGESSDANGGQPTYQFKMSKQMTEFDFDLTIRCKVCAKDGHHEKECPDNAYSDVFEPLVPLPPKKKKFTSIINDCIYHYYDKSRMSQKDRILRFDIIAILEDHLRLIFPSCVLEMFGSCGSGFGKRCSDLDVCFRLNDKVSLDMDSQRTLIVKISDHLKKLKAVYNVCPITESKVPIVRFIYRHPKVEIDICAYNLLALENTRLLLTYNSCDRRLAVLGSSLKNFAKHFEIGDASRGSLSSYAYIILLIHYLQHTNPPVLPVLQEMYDTPEQPKRIIEGFNTYFKEAPTFKSKNNDSAGSLWIGFFSYFLEEFDLNTNVVSIKQFAPLTKFEKSWNSKSIAIEDPFELTHNLAAGLTHSMANHIKKVFIKAREVFGTPIEVIGTYSFDRFFRLIQKDVAEIPKDNLCKICSKIGHIARECPVKEMHKRRREQKRQSAISSNDKPENSKSPGSSSNTIQVINNFFNDSLQQSARPMHFHSQSTVMPNSTRKFKSARFKESVKQANMDQSLPPPPLISAPPGLQRINPHSMNNRGFPPGFPPQNHHHQQHLFQPRPSVPLYSPLVGNQDSLQAFMRAMSAHTMQQQMPNSAHTNVQQSLYQQQNVNANFHNEKPTIRPRRPASKR